MIKQRINAMLVFLLLATFLAVKWMPSHAHLNAHHDHGSAPHKHSFQAHAHQPVVFHDDPIGLDHQQLDKSQVVDLDHDLSSANGKQFNNPVVLAAFVYYLPLIQTREIGLPECCNFPPRLLPTHSGQPRAPPVLS